MVSPEYSLRPVGLAVAEGKPIQAYEIVGSALDPSSQVSKRVLTVKQLLTPLSGEEIKVVRCLGLNYSDHAVSTSLHILFDTDTVGRRKPI